MTIEEMKERKRELGITNEQIAKWTGVPLATVQKIFAGVTESPRYKTLRSLETLFVRSDDARERTTPLPGETCVREDPFADIKKKEDGQDDSLMRGEALAYGSQRDVEEPAALRRQGQYTITDYYMLPDDQRYELIDGYLYDMAAPTTRHQMIGEEICFNLHTYIRSKKGACLPMMSPVDVQLDCDDRTMVQPDVIVICDRSKVINRCVYGAPDFIVEVLSPSTKRKDGLTKMFKYLKAGVREYWLVDPMKKQVIVYDFEHDELPVIYGADAVVPVSIFGGECTVDFGEIFPQFDFIEENEERMRQEGIHI